MEAYKYVTITCIIAGTIVFILSFLFMTLSYNKTGSGKYNFFSRFPYELNQFKRHNKITAIYVTMMILASLLLLFGLVFYLLYYYNHSILYFICAVIFVAIIAFNLLFFTKLSAYKLHLVLALIFYFSTLLTLVTELFCLTSNNVVVISNPVLNIIVIIITLLFMLIILINPTYKTWNKMVKVDAQTYNRPKYNYLAMLEWGSFLGFIISFFPLIVSLY